MLPAISVTDLSKRYKLGVTHAGSIRELVNRTAGRLVGRNGHHGANGDTEVLPEHAERVDDDGHFWALKDVNFEVSPGEVVGIIGKNGAGKSTLLKILSRITKPTAGEIRLRGRVASLLEVGTGFHPELTGRENVYLNGTILGMTKAEVDRQFDAIVDFSGVEKFIDTPVKRYSSGMTVRLGFAVAAHLDPEILIVDEVLAVGDFEFQKRCLQTMRDAAVSGRTVLFVSHNLQSIKALTRESILLGEGAVLCRGATSAVLQVYQRGLSEEHAGVGDVSSYQRSHKTSGNVRIVRIDPDQMSSLTDVGQRIAFVLTLEAERSSGELCVSLTVFADRDTPVGTTFSHAVPALRRGECKQYQCTLSLPVLKPGEYRCGIAVSDQREAGKYAHDVLLNVLPFRSTLHLDMRQKWCDSWGHVVLDAMECTSLPVEKTNWSTVIAGERTT